MTKLGQLCMCVWMYLCSLYELHNNIYLEKNMQGLQKFITKEKTSFNLNKTKETSVNKSSLKTFRTNTR